MGNEYCVMFAGQSVQETAMGTELWKNPTARKILKRLSSCLGEDLEYITTEMPEVELAKTMHAQRAIHACHLGHWFAYLAAHPGTELDGAIGHSMGVAAALVAAGSMTVEDSGVFIRARAQAFSDVCSRFDAPQGLAAVAADFLGDYIEWTGLAATSCPGRSPTRCGLRRYFPFYNGERFHESLAYQTPAQVYSRGVL